MSIGRLLTQPLLVQSVNGPGVDEYGNPAPGEAGPPVTEYGFLEQKDTTETVLDRQTVVSRWKVYLPKDSTVTATGYITFDGKRFQVDGEPWRVFNPRRQVVDHVEANLTVVT